MGAIGIQYYGVDAVLDAAKNFRCAAWAIFIRSSLFMKFEDDDLNASLSFLEQALISLEPGGTDAIYTIKFFEPAENGKVLKINEKSVCTAGGFTFKLTDPAQREQRALGYAVQSNHVLNQVNERIDKLEKMFIKLMEQEPEPEPETVGTVLIDALKNPEQLMHLINAGKMLLGFPIQEQPPVHAIGNVNSTAGVQQQQQEYSEELILRLQTAVSTLEKNDPKLVEHLEKLAVMSETDKGTFSFLLSMLDKK